MPAQSTLSWFHRSALLCLLAALWTVPTWAQFGAVTGPTTLAGAQFGEVISLGGAPGDIVLDEDRQRIYAVNSGSNRVVVYDYAGKRTANYIGVGTYPSSAAMSPDKKYLYVTNAQSASLSVIDLDAQRSVQTISLPARPEGVAAGADGRVLITTQGTGTGNTLNTLLIFDPRQEAFQQLTPVPTPPTLSTPNPLPAVFVGRPTTAFPGRLMTTPDGQFIIGMVAINQTANNALTTVFVYEVASGTVLRNRTVTGQSTVLSISPDGSRFMAGSTLYETATMSVIAVQNTATLPFLFSTQGANPALSNLRNFGGSVFTPDGSTIYNSFNFGGNANNSSIVSDILLISNSANLGSRLGIRMPENIIGKMVMISNGAEVWATSQSGLVYLPVGKLFDYPILEPESRQVFLSSDLCNKGLAKASVRVNNIGSGKATFSVPNPTNALVSTLDTGVAPGTVTFILEPGRTGVNRRPGTNLYIGAGTGSGQGVNVTISSANAINFPSSIRIFMNLRESDQRGVVFPIPSVPSGGEFHAPWELILDEPRGRVYISNPGYNRVEVFDTRRQKFLDPIAVGQLPRAMAMTVDRNTLYVGNNGGESISVIDLETRRAIGGIEFPPIPRAGNQNAITPIAMAAGLSGLQFVMSNGGIWRVISNVATPRPPSSIISTNPAISVLIGGQYAMTSSPGGEYIVALAGNGNVYLYDSLADAFTASNLIQTNPIQSYYGPSTAAPNANFFAINGLILSPSLAVIGGTQRPSATQVRPPAGQGQPPQVTIISTGQRHIAAHAAIDESRFARLTIPVRQNAGSTTRDDYRTTIELVDIRSGAESVVAVTPDNPTRIVFGTQRMQYPARQMAVDSTGTAYVLGVSGLSVVPLTLGGISQRPQVTGGTRGIVNSNTGSPNFSPGSFITITGTSLAGAATADTLPLPSVLGGSCVTLSDVPLPILQTSESQISAQIPSDMRPGIYVAQIRSLANAQSSDPVLIRVGAVQ